VQVASARVKETVLFAQRAARGGNLDVAVAVASLATGICRAWQKKRGSRPAACCPVPRRRRRSSPAQRWRPRALRRGEWATAWRAGRRPRSHARGRKRGAGL